MVGDLQKQRQELSVAVRQLTDKSQNLGLISPTKQAQQSAIESYNSKGFSINCLIFNWVKFTLTHKILIFRFFK